MKQFDCITVGDLFIDIVMSGFASLPRHGEEAFATGLQREVGGGAAITACGLAKLGARVGLLGMLGGSDGQWVAERLKNRNVNIGGIRYHLSEPTGLTVAASSTEDRAFLSYNGANQFLKELLHDPSMHGWLATARHVHFAMPISPGLLRSLTDFLHQAGARVSVDVGWHPDWLEDEQSIDALKQVDLFFPNEREAGHMTGQSDPEAMLQAMGTMGLSNVALKLGSDGAMLLWDDEIFACPPQRIRPIDTTGAGDCFNAGFLYGTLLEKSPEQCLQLGNLCGGLSTLGLGGLASFPERDKVLSILSDS